MPAKSTPKFTVAREKLVTVWRKPSDRIQREFADELESLAAQGYRIAAIKRHSGQVDIHLVKHDEWTVQEVLDEVFAPNGGSFAATGH